VKTLTEDAQRSATDTPEKRLWGSVLIAAIGDCCGYTSHSAEKPEIIVAKADVWLRSEDFGTVCDLAGMDRQATRELIARLRRHDDPAKAYRLLFGPLEKGQAA